MARVDEVLAGCGISTTSGMVFARFLLASKGKECLAFLQIARDIGHCDNSQAIVPVREAAVVHCV